MRQTPSDDLVLLLGKGAQPDGRFFQKDPQDSWIAGLFPDLYRKLQFDWQNWYRSTELAADVAKNTNAEVLILSAVETSEPPSREYHRAHLEDLGIEPRMQPCIYETIGELEKGFEIAEEEDRRLHLIISDIDHYLRIRWLVWWGRRQELLSEVVAVEFHFTFGVPRLNQLVTGIPGVLLTIIADLLGKREELKQFFVRRRKAGKQ